MKAAILPTYRFYQGPHLVQRLVGDQCQRVMRNIDQPLVLIQDQRSLALECDMQGSTHVAGGQHIKGYSPYGHRLVTDTALIAYTGEWFEPLLSGYMLGNGYRTYSTALMRFQAPDNLSPFGEGGLNAYCYCSDDPINHSDPSGHMIGINSLRRPPTSKPAVRVQPHQQPLLPAVPVSGSSSKQIVVTNSTPATTPPVSLNAKSLVDQRNELINEKQMFEAQLKDAMKSRSSQRAFTVTEKLLKVEDKLKAHDLVIDTAYSANPKTGSDSTLKRPTPVNLNDQTRRS